ncbi:WD40-repeat-containing domain protein [Aspergillus coremiiformis]|uniref:WD40-repeat-containing domain protein n=1 Tax=Aspergillus coremiiformis TaxID=138285 RepID=A0A5N6YYH8_9EURO|nr:WD40-repeat-containing domain protein [Aspergillus coremiiformis]
MPPTLQSPSLASILVARFLRTNNYSETLDAFIREAGLPANAGQVKENDKEKNWTIESVLEEKKVFDRTLEFERYGEKEEKDVWTVPAPSNPKIVETTTSSNILACSVDPWTYSNGDPDNKDASSYLIATGADKQLHLFKTDADHDAITSFPGLSESPILSYASIRNGKYICLTNMSGQLLLQRNAQIIDRRKDHTKYTVKVIAFEDDNSPQKPIWLATAGWDSKIHLYHLHLPAEATEPDSIAIGEPVASITLASNPESILFIQHPDTKQLLLLVSRRDSTHLYYYQVPRPSSTPPLYECSLLGKQNLAPHSNAWVAFSPSCLALNPHDPELLAVATSTLPHMKVIIVRLLFPSTECLDVSSSGPIEGSEPVTQATQAFAALALQNREDAAILVQANTFAPQTAYSTPQVVWRPDGSGVWVNGDDGGIRGVEMKTGKVVTVLKDGHVAGSKIRTIWAGWVDVSRDGKITREEWLVSGGFDKRLIVWKP